MVIVKDRLQTTLACYHHLQDAPLVAALRAACGLAEGPTSPTTHAVLLTDEQGRCVGFAALDPGAPPHTRLLLRTLIHPAYSGQGLRGILLGWAEDEARDNLLPLAPPAARVVIAAWVRPGARRCYAFAGFQHVLDGEITSLMEMELRA